MSLAQRRAAARARLQKSRAGRAFLGIGGRAGQLALPLIAGGAAQMVGQMAREKVSAVGSRWYGEPLALGAAAFLAIRRKPNVAYALAGAAGYAGAFAYRLKAYQEGKGANPIPQIGGGAPAPVAQLAPAVKQAAGYDYQAGAIEDAVGF